MPASAGILEAREKGSRNRTVGWRMERKKCLAVSNLLKNGKIMTAF